MRIVVIDNYDSFTYNLVYLLRDLGVKNLEIYRNDSYDSKVVEKADKLLFSPGPGIPSEAGDMLKLIKQYANQKSILGVCLGHQAIGEYFGAKLIQLNNVYHGVSTKININNQNPLFKGLGSSIVVGRYHSWVIDNQSLPNCLEIISEDENKLVMGIGHKSLPIYGVQFHPESIMTEQGADLIDNWLKL